MLKAVQTMDMTQEVPVQPVSLDIWDKKYRLKTKKGESIDKTMDDTFKRVARALADAEDTEEKRALWYEKFLWALRRGAIPAGRITSNAGALEHKPATSTINCTVSAVASPSRRVMTTSARQSPAERRMRRRISSVPVSAQCRSSTMRRHGLTAARRRNIRATPSAASVTAFSGESTVGSKSKCARRRGMQ